MLQDELARRQQEQAFQQQVQLQQTMIAEQRQRDADERKYDTEVRMATVEGDVRKAELANQQAAEARARKMKLTTELTLAGRDLTNRAAFIESVSREANGALLAAFDERFQFNARLGSELDNVASRYWSGTASESPDGATSDFDLASQIAYQSVNMHVNGGLTDNNLGGNQNQIRRTRQLVENLLAIGRDSEMPTTERVAESDRIMLEIAELNGAQGKQVVREAIKSLHDLMDVSTTNPDGSVTRASFGSKEDRKAIATLHGITRSGYTDDLTDMVDPQELTKNYLLTINQVLTMPDPETGQPIGREERMIQLNNATSSLIREAQTQYGFDDEKAAELTGMFEAWATNMLPFDEKMAAYEDRLSQASTDEEYRAIVDSMELAQINTDTVLEFLSKDLEDQMRVRAEKLNSAKKDESVKGDEEKSGIQSSVRPGGSNAATSGSS